MAERLIIRISPSSRYPDLLKVQDVFAQVVDLFDMAAHSESDVEDLVIWRLVSASVESPFTVVAEAVSARPGIDIQDIARAQKEEFVRNLKSLRRGEIPQMWSGAQIKKTVARVLGRNQNGIGEIVVIGDLDSKEAALISVTPEDGTLMLDAFADAPVIPTIKSKTQIGSLEGLLLSVSSYRGKPAIRLRERKSGNDVWCIVEQDHVPEIAAEANFNDVWEGQRVLLRGRIEYSDSGQIARIYVNEIHKLKPKAVDVGDIEDKDFTGGLSAAEYLDKLRDGDLG